MFESIGSLLSSGYSQGIYQPTVAFLTTMTQTFGSIGWAIIALTVLLRSILVPITHPSLQATAKMRDLQPEIKALKKKFKDDPAGLQQAQMELFKEHNINPMAGCLPQLLQIAIFIALYNVFITYLNSSLSPDSTSFFWLDVSKPDPYYVLPFLAAGFQLLLGLMLAPGADTTAEKTVAASSDDTKDDDDADSMTAMASSLQQQMIFFMPFMTFLIALKFPSGLAIYWIVSTVFSIVQQYYVSGWGSLFDRMQQIQRFISKQK